jgi:hypothetical protein
VRRRYSDFEYLHTHFSRIYPFSIIPPIPSKQSLNTSISALFRQDGGQATRIVDRRVRAFNMFLRQALSHPILYSDHALHLFLTVPESLAWKAEVVKYPPTEVKNPGPKLPRTFNQSFEEILSSLPLFEENCRSLEASQRAILRKMQDQLGALQQLGTAYNSFSLEYAPLADVLDALGEVHDGEAAVFADVVTSQQLLCEATHEILQTIGAIRKALYNFASPVTELQLFSERTNQLRSEVLQQIDKNGGRTNSPSESLSELEEQERILKDKVEFLRASLWEQLAIWITRLRTSWNTLLLDAASAEKTFADQGLFLWKNIE